MKDQPKATHLTWHEGQVHRDQRYGNLGQRGTTLWMTGLSGSGKSTIAVALEQRLHGMGRHAYRLDGDNIRMGLCSNLGFSAEDRSENIRRIGEVSKLFADAGLIVINSFISPYARQRTWVRELHEAEGLAFYEIYIHVPLAVAEARDPKGLYRKARAGEIAHFTGIDDPFEAPVDPALELRTDTMSVEQAVDALIALLKKNNHLTA